MTSDFRSMTWLVLWMAGLVIALLTGNLSLYLILSALYFGSRGLARLRAHGSESPPELGPGE